MSLPQSKGNFKSEGFEWISNRDLVDSAHLLMNSIDLDPASSKIANEYVNAKQYFTPTDDGLNVQQWHGSVYLFPPHLSYFWDKKGDRWKATRGMSPSLVSGHAIWWRTLRRKWLAGEVEQAIYFTDYMDMMMYNQDIFDFPICIMKQRPSLVRRYFADDKLEKKCTGCSFIVYLQPKDNVGEATEAFIDIYSEKGRIIV